MILDRHEIRAKERYLEDWDQLPFFGTGWIRENFEQAGKMYGERQRQK